MRDRFVKALHVFKLRYDWSYWIGLVDSPFTRLAAVTPVLGYLILFNDSISEILSFETLTAKEPSVLDLQIESKLQLIYLGLLFLSLSYLIYRLRRPHVVRFGRNVYEYVDFGFQNFGVQDIYDFAPSTLKRNIRTRL